MHTPSNTDFLANLAPLSQLAAASLRANGELMGSLLAQLPPQKHAVMQQVLQGGGAVGIETLTDRHATCRVVLVAVELEGRRTVLMEVASAGKKTLQ
jgi:hypothetical protein